MLTLSKLLRRKPAEQQQSEPPDWAWTKDTHILERYFHQLMFIPDEWMEGQWGNEHIKDISVAVISPVCYTHNPFFAYQREIAKGKHQPVFLPGDYHPSGFMYDPPPPGKIRGQLHLVWSNRIYLLDKLRQNGVQYARHRVKITYPYRFVQYGKKHPLPKISSHCFTTVVAWMYVGVPSYWDSRIGGVLAKPMQLYEHDTPRAWIGPFYKFE